MMQKDYLQSDSNWDWIIKNNRYIRQRDRFVTLGSVSNWSNQENLRKLEDQLARQYWVNVFLYSELDWQIQRYLALTSLPFDIIDTANEKTLEDIPDWAAVQRERLKKLWPIQKQIEGLVYRPTQPTGNMYSKYIVIGDAPGVHTGPFLQGEFDRVLVYGPSSHLLRKALIQLKMHQDTWYTNLLKLSTPQNRPSTLEEVNQFRDQLENEIMMISPDIAILLGAHVKKQWDQFNISDVQVITIYHPSYYVRLNKSFQEYATHIQERAKEVGVEL